MTTRKPKLSEALHQASAPSAEVAAVQTGERREPSSLPPSRQGKKAVSGHFDPEASRQLKQLAIETDSTVQTLLAEALNDLFTKHGKPPIA